MGTYRTLKAEKKLENRIRLEAAIRKASSPEKTGQHCFDFMSWSRDTDARTLRLGGDFATPDFNIAFFKGRQVYVERADTGTAETIVDAHYENLEKLGEQIVKATLSLSGASLAQ